MNSQNEKRKVDPPSGSEPGIEAPNQTNGEVSDVNQLANRCARDYGNAPINAGESKAKNKGKEERAFPPNNRLLGPGGLRYNHYRNRNIVTETNLKPVFYDDNFSVIPKAQRMEALNGTEARQAKAGMARRQVPSGITCAENWGKADSLAKVAGYLLFHLTRQYQTWVDTEVADLIHPYVTLSQEKYHAGKKRPLMTNVFHALREVHNGLYPEFTLILATLSRHNYPIITSRHFINQAGQESTVHDLPSPLGNTIVAMWKILLFTSNAEERFLAIHEGEDNSKARRILGYTVEAWHRAWIVLLSTFSRRHHASPVNHFPTSDRTANKPNSLKVQYLGRGNIRMVAEGLGTVDSLDSVADVGFTLEAEAAEGKNEGKNKESDEGHIGGCIGPSSDHGTIIVASSEQVSRPINPPQRKEKRSYQHDTEAANLYGKPPLTSMGQPRLANLADIGVQENLTVLGNGTMPKDIEQMKTHIATLSHNLEQSRNDNAKKDVAIEDLNDRLEQSKRDSTKKDVVIKDLIDKLERIMMDNVNKDAAIKSMDDRLRPLI